MDRMDTGSIVGAVLGGGAAAGGAGGFAIYMIKRWIERTERALEKNTNKLHDLELEISELKGKENIVFRDMDSIKSKQTKQEGRIDAAWDVIGEIANPRVMDALKQVLREQK